MKVILKQDVKSLGKKGELVTVNDGYGRNYLIAKGFAVEANAKAMNELKNRQSADKYHKEQELKGAKETAAVLQGKTVKICAKAGSNGKLFGSITSKDISAVIKKEFDIDIDKKKISCEDIKSFGTFTAEIKLPQGVTATVYVSVVTE